jgi:hypothetical protein
MILLDDLRWVQPRLRRKRRGKERWAHMVSDTSLEELHDMAEQIGLQPEWFQGDHYDVRPRQHARALARGAIEVGRRELVTRMVGRR